MESGGEVSWTDSSVRRNKGYKLIVTRAESHEVH